MRQRIALPTLALAVAMALAGCGEQTSEDPPDSAGEATPSTATSIPDDFPLTHGMAGHLSTSRTGTGLRDLALCDVPPAPLRGLGIRDRMISQGGGDTAETRELMVLGNPEEPQLVAQAFTDLARECAGPDGLRLSGTDVTVTIEVRESSYAPSPAATLVQTYESDDQRDFGQLVIQVVPMGSALLVSETYGEWWSDAERRHGIDETVAALSGTVEAMAIFTDRTATSLPEAPAIPDDFPLAVGMEEDGGDFTRMNPSRDTHAMGRVEMCGQVVWPVEGAAGGTDRLVTHVEGPEYYDARDLVAYADSEVAQNVMAPIRQAAQDCRSADNQVWTPLAEDTGYDTVTMGLSYDDGLGSSVLQFTRVGSAVLFTTTYGEGSLESLPRQARELTRTTRAIAPAMCAFTEVGC